MGKTFELVRKYEDINEIMYDYFKLRVEKYISDNFGSDSGYTIQTKDIYTYSDRLICVSYEATSSGNDVINGIISLTEEDWDNLIIMDNNKNHTVEELIKKYQKQLDFLNERLETALYIVSNQQIIIDTEKILLKQIINDLIQLK